MVTFFCQLITEKIIDLNNVTDRENFEALIATFTKTQCSPCQEGFFFNFDKYGLKKFKFIISFSDIPYRLKNIVKKPLFDASELVRDFVIDFILKDVQIEFFLRILDRILQLNNDRYWAINWSTDDGFN